MISRLFRRQMTKNLRGGASFHTPDHPAVKLYKAKRIVI